jgi:transglutaminase-like putative cysteine protease
VRIGLGYELSFQCAQPTPMILVLTVHPTRTADLWRPDHMATDPWVPLHMYRDAFENWCTRLVAPAGLITFRTDAVIEDSGMPDPIQPDAAQVDVEDLPADTLVYLLGSRYCETDRLSDIAWNLFGHTAPGWTRVEAVCDFVHQRLKFGYDTASPTRTAHEAFEEARGVSRDFAHLAITLCRCLNIPARYCTGYLGDIGMPPANVPMDFSAWFEAYLGHRWFTFDARHNVPRIGRVLIARGRDAADVAISTSFGPCSFKRLRVWTDELPSHTVT